MSSERHARRAFVRVSINGHDATAFITPSLLDFSYTDNCSGKADEVQLSLQDREARWNGPWKPQKGMKIVASLSVKDWFAQGEDATLSCGSFKIDEISLDGPPDIFKIKAVSAALTSNLREEKRTRAWENQSLKGIATQLAGEHGLELHDESNGEGENSYMVRQDQREEADLPFIHRLAHERAMHCKVHDGKLILADSVKAEQQNPVLTLSRVGTDTPVTRYSFKQSSSGTAYTKAEAAYTDSSTGQVHTATAQVAHDSADANPKTMQLNARVESSAEAMRLTSSALHNANKSKDTASVDCMGHPGLVAGLTVNLADFGDFSGSYLIEKATHRLGNSGYTTALELRKCRLAPDIRMSSGSVPVAKNIPIQKADLQPLPPVNSKEKWATLFDMHRQFWLASGVDALTRLLLCLPQIAESMAEKAGNSNDAQGWLYLQSMFEHWFSGKSSKYGKEGEPFWVDWEWVMRFKRAHYAYAMFVDPNSQESPHIANAAALQQLGRILQRNGYLTDRPRDFDFINTPWTEWEDKYHTLTTVPRIPSTDGLMVALAGFTLRALAKGHVQPNGTGGHSISIEAIAVFVHDKFQFAEDEDAAANHLWYWRCSPPDFSLLDREGYAALENKLFRDFCNGFGNGGDFLVFSQPNIVETFQGKRYEYS